jgi:tRNA A-37 threonylcarbamoyl transferase component Bud32
MLVAARKIAGYTMVDDSLSQTVFVWDNGAKAVVSHVKGPDGIDYISKVYRKGQFHTFLRELMVLKFLGPRVSCVPAVLSFDLSRRETFLNFIGGERVLEWVLRRFGGAAIDIDSFASFHGLETDATVSAAFEAFRASTCSESLMLKQAILRSYAELHKHKFVHGDPSPRNLIFDGDNVSIIDFDHSRPSLQPRRVDGLKIRRWYGVKY